MSKKKMEVDFDLVLAWAERDQRECLTLATNDSEASEARANLDMIALARERVFSPEVTDPDPEFGPMCAYCLNPEAEGHQSDCDRPRKKKKSSMRFECCGADAKSKSDICILHDGKAEPKEIK